MDTIVSLKRAKMYYDKKYEDYFLKLVYVKEDDTGIYEITFHGNYINKNKRSYYGRY